MPAVVDLENLRADVDAAVARHLEALEAQVAALGRPATALTAQAAALLGGGKRLRAAFAYWSFRAHGGADAGPEREAVVRTGAALELFQAAALLHDDVMDASDTRRGQPTAHRAFEARHATAGWAGEPVRFGESAAILLGDLCLVATQREIAEALAPLPRERAEAVRAAFDTMQSEVIVGQYLDVLVQAEPWGLDPHADEERARAVIRAKTTSYSVRQPLVVGALIAGATPAQVAAVAAVGLPLGEAFQLRDDVLGVFGDPEVTGKPAGDDLREGKRTVLAARTMAAGDAAQRALLAERLGDAHLTDDDVAALREAVVASGALAGVEALIAELADDAISRLEAADLAAPGKDVLLELAHAAVDRAF
ncbi:Polyprenyl synthetase [Xylanimonas cellulosilytica DSM 15894]|uniref:Polyprenyl synthetase n=1 Tax=Xylanimonas cellulosilytica (strain DSM 15894 / JCM 12276 / CECT 5975 / KCTC 9989 / LMG 20990 / NBRC 107835 / XIL07) TaxID=446471 RepID=D1BTN5_XYLCX|nr:polyprenyl synthetase family protein [Xylanimonas cellulosilytica]ACZ31014.1 Polyprenyl synthetase [Xylanimonas cellulosilytica DSM 15894]